MVVCTRDLENMQLIMVLHTKGTVPGVGGSSFREKVNFRSAVH